MLRVLGVLITALAFGGCRTSTGDSSVASQSSKAPVLVHHVVETDPPGISVTENLAADTGVIHSFYVTYDAARLGLTAEQGRILSRISLNGRAYYFALDLKSAEFGLIQKQLLRDSSAMSSLFTDTVGENGKGAKEVRVEIAISRGDVLDPSVYAAKFGAVSGDELKSLAP